MELSLHVPLPKWVADLDPPALFQAQSARMAFVIDLARRNVAEGSGGPFGAAVFERDSGRLVAFAANHVVGSACALAHAEMLALGIAQQRLGSFDLGADGLPAHELVTSSEPCLMCQGAALWSGVRRVVFAARDEDVRQVGFDEGPKHPAWADELRARGIEVIGDVLREEAVAVLRDYAARGGHIYNARRG